MSVETQPKGAATVAPTPSAEDEVAAFQAEFLKRGNLIVQDQEQLFTDIESGNTAAANATRARIAANELRRQEIGLQIGGPPGSPERGLGHKANVEKAQRLADELSAALARVQSNGAKILTQRQIVKDTEALLVAAQKKLAALNSDGSGRYDAQLQLKKFLVAHPEIDPASLLPKGVFSNVA
jgi:hypothetical protein